MATSRKDAKPAAPRRPPATTPQARENQLIALAIDEAEKQLRAGTASSQVITHFLKLGTVRESLEREKITHENELLKARSEAIASGARMEELYGKAIQAMRGYQGQDVEEEFDE